MHLEIDTAYFHHVCIMALYASMVLLAFVIVERFIYYVLLNMRANRVSTVFHTPTKTGSDMVWTRRDLITRSIGDYLTALQAPGISRARLEDLSAALFITVNGKVGARLWMLDTIVTAAPLVGLLGTILGIMDTFNALSAGGISDPAAVSRGIGAALLATAIGIGTALFGLLGHNMLHRMADHVTEEFKRLLLLAESYAAAREPSAANRVTNIGSAIRGEAAE